MADGKGPAAEVNAGGASGAGGGPALGHAMAGCGFAAGCVGAGPMGTRGGGRGPAGGGMSNLASSAGVMAAAAAAVAPPAVASVTVGVDPAAGAGAMPPPGWLRGCACVCFTGGSGVGCRRGEGVGGGSSVAPPQAGCPAGRGGRAGGAGFFLSKAPAGQE
eukprot:922262-Pelagomonas_calceolata.AAC.3